MAGDLNPKFIEAVANTVNSKALWSPEVFYRIMVSRKYRLVWWRGELQEQLRSL